MILNWKWRLFPLERQWSTLLNGPLFSTNLAAPTHYYRKTTSVDSLINYKPQNWIVIVQLFPISYSRTIMLYGVHPLCRTERWRSNKQTLFLSFIYLFRFCLVSSSFPSGCFESEI
jgi:hypothetical protein